MAEEESPFLLQGTSQKLDTELYIHCHYVKASNCWRALFLTSLLLFCFQFNNAGCTKKNIPYHYQIFWFLMDFSWIGYLGRRTYYSNLSLKNTVSNIFLLIMLLE